MGSYHSIQEVREDEDEDGDDDQDTEEEEEDVGPRGGLVPAERAELSKSHLVKKVLEQEPEILPCHASASPLSPQLSSLGTPRMGPSIKVWDPYNVLAPMPPQMPPPPSMIPNAFVGNYPGNGMMEEDRDQRGSSGDRVVEVYLVSEGESEVGVRRGEVVVGGGRWTDADLTGNGKRQARALAVLLSSRGVRFGRVFSSPVVRAKEMARLVCREMNFSEEQIQLSEALADMSHGIWEGCSLSEKYTPEILGLMDRLQPDFAAPSGESLREVEFRIIHFLNRTVLGLPEKLQADHPSQQNLHSSNSARHRLNFPKKKSGKSRLQFVTCTGDHHDMEDDNSPRDASASEYSLNGRRSDGAVTSSVGIFTHSLPIKCIITGLLGCSPAMANKICINDSSITVLQHSWMTGWQIKSYYLILGNPLSEDTLKFATFETAVKMIYKYGIPTPKHQCSMPSQLGVSFVGGYIDGISCAVVSHPADNLVSFLNSAKGAIVGDALQKFGLWGLFTRGLPISIFMIGTRTGAQWVIHDSFKVFVGLPTTGGATPAAAVNELAEVLNMQDSLKSFLIYTFLRFDV